MWFISIHPLVKVRVMGKEVSNGIIMTWNISKGVVEVLEILNPTSLSARDLVRLMEILKIFVIGMHLNWVSGS